MTSALTYIEIDIPFCANTYGSLPCTATLVGPNPTGTIKCFNSPRTCQDRAHYVDAPVTLRFAEDVGYLMRAGIDCIPSVTGINYTPATVSLGEDLGTRASLSVTFKDHAWPDTGAGFDKYRTERPYNPYLQGTFWGKFRARQPFLRGRPMRLIRGVVGQALGDMETRHYLIDSFTHNTANGTYTITAKDVLKFADDDRAQAPVLSNGFLNAAVANNDLLVTLQPAGIGNEEYPTSGHVAIAGKEVCAFTRDPTGGNDANCVLLLHMDGNNAATVFTDSSSSAKAITANGNVQLTTATKVFGSAAAIFDGTGDYLSLLDSNDWTPGSGSFTIEGRFRWNALGTQHLFGHATDVNNRYFLQVSATGVLTWSVISAGVTIVTMASAAGAVAVAGAYYHIAVIRSGNVWRITVDGVQVATVTDADAIPNFTGQFRIGADYAAANGFNGWCDEFRVSNIARWTVFPFSVPPSPYQISSNVLALVRAQLGTSAIAHDAGDRVQLLLRYDGQDVADIIRDLLVNFAGVPDTYVPLAAWKTETASFLNRVFTADIAEPVGVKTLLAELVEDGALSLWWDDLARLVRLRVLRAIATDAETFDRDNYLEGSFSSTEQPNKRVSQIWRYFAKRNPCEGQDDPDNYRSVAATVDLEAETDYGSPVIQKIFSRWIPFGGRNVADRANALYLSRYRDPPRRFKFATFRSSALVVPQLGQGYRIGGIGLQDATGASINAPIQVTRLNPGDAQIDVEAEEMLVAPIDEADLVNRVIVIDANAFNFNLRTVHDTLYPAPTLGDVGAGVNLRCYVESGVIVGSNVSTSPAFDVGTWPLGLPITLIINGRIQGAGGGGGRRTGGLNDGAQGGTAIYTRKAINIEVASGAIWGGGGGGGVGSRMVGPGDQRPGSGGGGGAGTVPGIGGLDYPSTVNGNVVRGEVGQSGTQTTGGAGGVAVSGGRAGGAGGGPGLAGAAGGSGLPSGGPGAGGAAGNSIDGNSYVTVTAGPGDVRGPQIN